LLLELLLLPPGCVVAAGLIACALAFAGRRRAAAGFAALGLLALALLSAPVVSRWLASRSERDFAPLDPGRAERADAIAVLGGGLGPALPPRRSPDLNAASDRVVEAARLYRAGRAPLVIAVGGRSASSPAPGTEADDMAELLQLLGVPEGAIVRERASTTTTENCANLERIARERAIRHVLLVTSALHMARALQTCAQLGVPGLIPAPTDFESAGEEPRGLARWLPSARALARSAAALRECFARVAQHVSRVRAAK
jgi:uncharacterized SAM-binding protein YcdF (DUF218 family)